MANYRKNRRRNLVSKLAETDLYLGVSLERSGNIIGIIVEKLENGIYLRVAIREFLKHKICRYRVITTISDFMLTIRGRNSL